MPRRRSALNLRHHACCRLCLAYHVRHFFTISGQQHFREIWPILCRLVRFYACTPCILCNPKVSLTYAFNTSKFNLCDVLNHVWFHTSKFAVRFLDCPHVDPDYHNYHLLMLLCAAYFRVPRFCPSLVDLALRALCFHYFRYLYSLWKCYKQYPSLRPPYDFSFDL